MYYHLFFYLIWKVVKKHKTFFWESGVWYNLSGSVSKLRIQAVHNKMDYKFTLFYFILLHSFLTTRGLKMITDGCK